MPKTTLAPPKKPARVRSRKKPEIADAGFFIMPKLPNAKPWSTPRHHRADYEALAKMITADPPRWFVDYLTRSMPSALLARAVDYFQSTRSEIRNELAKGEEAAEFLRQLLGKSGARDFLDEAGTEPLGATGANDKFLADIALRAKVAAKSPALVDSKGNTKRGRGPAMPEGAISAQTYCALIIAEAWRWFHGKYPPPRKQNAIDAADLLWRLTGGQIPTLKKEASETWRIELQKVRLIKAQNQITEIRRQLKQAERFG